MVRTLLCDSEAKKSLAEWLAASADNFGLIVGQLSSSSSEDQAAFLAPTLPPQEDKAEFEEEEEVEEDDDEEETEGDSRDSSSDEFPSPPPPAATVVLEELTSSWVTHHSHQLSRLLTGGLDIIGIFVVCSPEALADLTKSGKLRSFFAVLEKRTGRRHEGLVKSHHYHRHQFLPLHSDRYLVHACSVTKKFSCKTLEVADAAVGGAQFKSADVKFLDGLRQHWSRVDCQFGLDCLIDIPSSKLSKYSLMKQIQQGLGPTLGELLDSRVLLRPNHEDADESHVVESVGTLPAAGACLFDIGKSTATEESTASHSSSSSSKSSRKGGGRKGQGDAAGKKATPALPIGRNFLASVFKWSGSANAETTTTTAIDCATQMLFKGTVCARAYLHAKATVEESIDALKRDMVHSILTRAELLCDDMLTEEDQETLPTGAVIYEMPVRIFAPLGGGGVGGGSGGGRGGDGTVSIADFMFRDERKADAVDRIKEVTGIIVAEDQLESSVESFMPTELSAASSIESLSSHHSGSNVNDASILAAADEAGLLLTSAKALKRHYVSALCVGAALAAAAAAYLHFDDVSS